MITGVVNANLEPTIPLMLIGGSGTRAINAIIDTGFNGFLTLPSTLVAALGLPRLGRGRAILADGSESLFDVYRATVDWHRQQLEVEADVAETDVLVGMSLLRGQKLRLHAVEGGTVTVTDE